MSKQQAKLSNKVANMVALFESKNDGNISKSNSVNKNIMPVTRVKESCVNYRSSTSKFEINEKENSSYCPLYNSKLRSSRTTSFIQNSTNKQDLPLMNKVPDSLKRSDVKEGNSYCPLYDSKLRPSRTISFIANSTNKQELSLNKAQVDSPCSLIKSKSLIYNDIPLSCETTLSPAITPRPNEAVNNF
jgi:hypothetical protein